MARSAQKLTQNFFVFRCQGFEFDAGAEFTDIADQGRVDDDTVLLHVSFVANAVARYFQNQPTLGAVGYLLIAIKASAAARYFQGNAFDDVIGTGWNQGCSPPSWVALMLA